ncbi:MAG: hypothetical protein KC912_17025 [Proteobacteria bacterium]|nr:hypothetical protein [Pseudomonadota bacterium]
MFTLLFTLHALASPPTEADLQACARAQVDNSFEAWSSYLEDHPKGICARAPAAADVKACVAAREWTDASLWQTYSLTHPRGFCATEAKSALHQAALNGDVTAPATTPPPLPARRERVGGVVAAPGPTSTTGALDEAPIRAALEPFAESLQGCGTGIARLYMTVLPDGALSKLEVEGVDEPTAECLHDALAPRLRFPEAEGPTRAVHRLVLGEAPTE